MTYFLNLKRIILSKTLYLWSYLEKIIPDFYSHSQGCHGQDGRVTFSPNLQIEMQIKDLIKKQTALKKCF